MHSAALSEELGLVHKHTVNLAERFRHLLMMARNGSGNRDQLLATVMEDFATALEELRQAGEELKVQQAAVAGLNASLAEHRASFHQFFELLPDPAVVTSPEGLIHDANEAALTFFRQPRARLIGKPLAAFVPRGHMPDFLAHLARATTQPSTEALCWQSAVRRYDGRLIEQPVECRLAPVTAPDGSLSRLHWLLRPVEQAQQPEAGDPPTISLAERKHAVKDPGHTLRAG